MVRAIFVLGMAGAAFATYTGPMFNPSEAAYFGPSAVVFPTLSDKVPTATQTPTFIRSITSAASMPSGNMTASVSASRSVQTSVSLSSSQLASSSASSSTTTSASRSASASAPPQNSAGAAAANGPAVVGVIAGGLMAGLALL